MKGIQEARSVVFISIMITIAASVFAILFNMVNPNGIDILKGRQNSSAYNVQVAGNEQDEDSLEAQKKRFVVFSENDTAGTKHVKGLGKSSSADSMSMSIKGFSGVQNKDEALKDSTGNVTINEIELITLQKAKEYFDKGEGFFVDARAEYSYYEMHIKGALSLSASRFDSQYEEFKDIIAKDALLIIYCHSITCSYSDIVASKLRKLGYTNIKIFAGGWAEWLLAKYPVQGFKAYL